MRKKLKDTRGETLVEVLASILIGALSVALLFSAVTASVSMDKKAQKADKDFNTVLNSAEKQEAAVDPGTTVDGKIIVPADAKVTVKNAAVSGDGVQLEVEFYGGNGAISYALKDTGEGGTEP